MKTVLRLVVDVEDDQYQDLLDALKAVVAAVDANGALDELRPITIVNGKGPNQAWQW